MIQNLKNSMKRSKYLRLLLVVPMVVLFLYCSVTLVNQSADISRMQKQKQTLTAQLASVQQENARLEEVVGADNKDDYIEQKAREKGYVKRRRDRVLRHFRYGINRTNTRGQQSG